MRVTPSDAGILTAVGEDFSASLHFAAQLPFEFHEEDAEPLPATLARLNTENLQVLHADASLAESHRLVDAKDEERPWLADLARLEYKLDVLMALVGRLLARDAGLPPSTTLRMFAHGLEWVTRESRPADGARGVVTLYVNPGFPQPLRLAGTVVSHRADEAGLWAQFRFESLSGPVVEMLEKLVFRHHRRQIAERRAGG